MFKVSSHFCWQIVAALVALGSQALGQIRHGELHASNIVIPQARSYAVNQSAVSQLVDVSASVSIRDQLATTALRIKLRNPNPNRVGAELLLPVPNGAVIRGFSYGGSNHGPTARVIRREEARELYRRIVSQQRDPALLEFVGYNLVRSTVFPIEPNSLQTISLTYEHLVDLSGERADYVLPRSESIEYAVPWNISVDISSTAPISAVYSPSHKIVLACPTSRTAHIELDATAKTDPGSFRLSYLRTQDSISASLFAYPDSSIGGGYFLLLAGLPPDEGKASSPSLAREVTLVIDHSGSMRGEKLAQVREAALQVLHGLKDGEYFNVILYNEAVEAFATRPERKSQSTLRSVSAFLENMTALGGTNIHDALLDSLRQPVTENTLPIVLFMTDGLPTIGQTSEPVIRDLTRRVNIHARRIFTFGVGVDVNTPLLEKIAYESRALATFVLPGENVELKVGTAFKRLNGPLFAGPVLRITDATGAAHRTRELIPAQLPDLFEGDQIVVLGQYVGESPLLCTLEGKYRGSMRSFQFQLGLDRASTRNAFVPRLWASRKIGLLVDAIREQGADSAVASREAKNRLTPVTRELVDEVVHLSTEFGILTEYTAFLANEGTDLTCKELVRSEAEEKFRSRAIQTRSGLASVNQEINNQALKSFLCPDPKNRFYDAEMCQVSVSAVQQVCDRTFYKRADRWIDSRLIEDKAALQPKRVVTFGSPEFQQLVERLAHEGRQGTIALRGDILLLIDGERVLVKAPADMGNESPRP
jgi:Ca-activated chloride channel family protein